MFYNNLTRKSAASFMLVVFVLETFFPVAAYALTSGPTVPEATSFEPVDTTDMVNLQTGDLTYNVPLMNLPGPEGGYPLSLSYHAGMQPNEDASWVGLGWTLNPGAITRSVNGYPDDWYQPTGSEHVYWSGGVRSSYSLGVGVGIANTPATVSYSLSFSQDTYKGFAYGSVLSAGGSLGGSHSPLRINASFGSDGYGNRNAGVGIGVSNGGVSLNLGIGTDFSSTYGTGSVGISEGRWSVLGASMRTGGGKPSITAAGVSANVHSSTTAQIRTSGSSFGIDVPIAHFFVSLGYSKYRYWTDETNTTKLRGSLYTNQTSLLTDNMVPDNEAFDSYSLTENNWYNSIINTPDPKLHMAGAYPEYDVYNVSAQGLGGNMRPYAYQSQVLGQNHKDDEDRITTYYAPPSPNSAPKFRFIGDFSNSYRQTSPYYEWNVADLKSTAAPFDQTPAYGNNDGNYGYTENNNLLGSKYIQVGLTVKPSNIKGYVKEERYQDGMIEGFSITNESGVTYHYGLPAYSWNEENYQEKYFEGININEGVRMNRSSKNTPYAYTWYLTTITGPDFVDRDGDNKAGKRDWGYWINFEYGKWSNDYVWRNPGEGYHLDEDKSWRNCSMGRKEVYYLNAIRSRTHAAIFVKDIRNDAKGSSPEIYNKFSSTNPKYNNAGLFNANSSSSLKLTRIYLLNENDANVSTGFNNNDYKPVTPRPIPCDCELGANIYDVNDLQYWGEGANQFKDKAIRIIDFNYDYSLCKNTPNSYDRNSVNVKSGKLTLKSLDISGKGGISILPPTYFEYDLSGTEQIPVSAQLSATSFTSSDKSFQVGDLIMKENGTDPIFCGIITRKFAINTSNTQYDLKNNEYTGAQTSAMVYRTKNPPYKSHVDVWGMYKGDFIPYQSTNEDLMRFTTPASSGAADVWSLRRIITPIGGQIKIKYESDGFSRVALDESFSFSTNTVSTDGPIEGNNYYNIEFTLNTLGLDIDDFFKVGRAGKLFLSVYHYGYTRIPKKTDYTVTAVDSDGTVHVRLTSPITMPSIQYGPTTIEFGNVLPTNNSDLYGGGIRVAQVSVVNSDGTEEFVNYDYLDPHTKLSSGVTSYLPTGLPEIQAPVNYIPSLLNSYKEILYRYSNELYSYARELPPPGVIYGYVTVSRSIKNPDEQDIRQIEGKTTYEFETIKDYMIGLVDVNTRKGGSPYGNQEVINLRNLSIQKFLGGIGNLKSVTQFDNNNRKISETVNHFLHDGLEDLPSDEFMSQYYQRLMQFNFQGYLKERYSEVKTIKSQFSPYLKQMATLSEREDFPCIPIGQTVTDYKNGTTNKTENLAFDFYSGSITKTVEEDSYGNRFMMETIPAYRKFAAMGIQMNNYQKHMLVQVAGSYVHKVDDNNNKVGLVSGQVQVWANTVTAIDSSGASLVQNNRNTTGDVWRLKSEHSWLPSVNTADGLTAPGNFVEFNWENASASSPVWKKTNDISLYDVYSKPLEVKDINSTYYSKHMSFDSRKVMLEGGPAKYYEMAYSGVEDDAINETGTFSIKKGNAVISTEFAHTGSRSLKMTSSGQKCFIYAINTDNLVAGKDYMLSVWGSGGASTYNIPDCKLSYKINGIEKGSLAFSQIPSSALQRYHSGKWKLLELKIKGSEISSGQLLEIECTSLSSSIGYLDDFRFHPFTSNTTAYVYDSFTGNLTYTLDNYNFYTSYEYDVAGRFKKVYKEIPNDLYILRDGKRLLKEYIYNFSQPLLNPPLIDNGQQQSLYVRADANFAYYDADDCQVGTFYNFYARFYKDPLCTIPAYVNQIPITYFFDGYTNPNNGSFVHTYLSPAVPLHTVLIGTLPVDMQYGCIGEDYGYNFDIEASPGNHYIKIP